MTVHTTADCTPLNESYAVKILNLTIRPVNESHIFSGKFLIAEQLPMNVEVETSLSRCNKDKTGCTSFDKITFSRICEKMSTKTSIAFKIVKGIRPMPSCPVAKGIYDLYSDWDFSKSIVQMLLSDGFLWRGNTKFYEKKGMKRVRILACMEWDLSVVKKTRRPKSRK